MLALLHEALTSTTAEADELVARLGSIYRGDEEPASREQVVALGFLACARALREASLLQEIAIREEVQELGRVLHEVLHELRRTEETVRSQAGLRGRRDRSLTGDLSPTRRTGEP